MIEPTDERARRTGDAETVRERFETMPLVLCSLVGPEHRVVAANAALRALMGWGDCVGSTLPQLTPEFEGQQIHEMWDRVYATGQPQSGEWRLMIDRSRSGTLEEVFINFTVEPCRDADGAIVGLDAYGVDVTEQVQRERAEQERTAAAQRRYEQARDVIATLQAELLPRGLPVLPGARIAGSYLLAEADTAAGGDWFDAVPLPDGRVALVVGDVVGHGVAASAVMGQLRAVLAERLDDGAGITAALDAVDRMAHRVPGARAATVCVAVLDPVSGAVTYCTAGHPPPLVVPPNGEQARYLPVTGAGPLGTGTEFTVGTATLAVGDLLLCYSDGILERPGRDLAASTVELAQVAADTAAGRALGTAEPSPAERVCTQTLELLVRATGQTDDITLLAAQRVDPLADLDLRVPAEPSAVPALRAELTRWLAEAGADDGDDDVPGVRHAVGELVTNAVEHAYRDAIGEVAVSAVLTSGGAIQIEVSDHGRWRETAQQPGRGHGLAMSRELVNFLAVEPRPDGTTSTVTHRLFRRARLLTADEIVSGAAPTAVPRAEPELLLILEQPHSASPRIRVDGPVDAVTAPQLHAELGRRTRGGTHPLTVDLTGVTHLASAGVAALHQALTTSTEGVELALYAPAGSTAQQIMSLVALPHITHDPDATEA